MSLSNQDGDAAGAMSELLNRARAVGKLPAPHARQRIRTDAGISQRELAGALGVDVMTLNRWERGLTQPRGEHAAAYASVLERLANAVISGA